MPTYGFECRGGALCQEDAPSLAEAIAQAEARMGSAVQRGRLLDGFDNEAPPGRPAYLVANQSPPLLVGGS